MVERTEAPDPNESAEEKLAAKRVGQSTTVEEAMDAGTDEDGFAEESAYTPSTKTEQDLRG